MCLDASQRTVFVEELSKIASGWREMFDVVIESQKQKQLQATTHGQGQGVQTSFDLSTSSTMGGAVAANALVREEVMGRRETELSEREMYIAR